MHSDISDVDDVSKRWWRPLTNAIGAWGTHHRRWMFIATAVGGVVAVVSQWVWTDVTPVVGETWALVLRWAALGLGILAALAVAVDKITDRWEDRQAADTLAAGEIAAERAVLALNVVLDEAIRTGFMSGKSRQTAVETLRRTAVQQAAYALGDGARATSYMYRREPSGDRVLDKAEHGTMNRKDKSKRPFLERESPDLEIWRMLERADDEPDVRRSPEEVAGLDWESKEYVEFLSVAVKARELPLGMLSVNHRDIGAIGGAQRAVVIAIARTIALATATSLATKELVERENAEKSQIRRNTDSGASVGGTTKGAE